MAESISKVIADVTARLILELPHSQRLILAGQLMEAGKTETAMVIVRGIVAEWEAAKAQNRPQDVTIN